MIVLLYLGSSKGGKFFVGVFDWILSSRSKKDEIIRICSVNRCMFVSKLHNNRMFQSYLLRNESSCYKNVTLEELRYRVSPLYPEKGQIKANFKEFFLNPLNGIYKQYKHYKQLPPNAVDKDKYPSYVIARIWITVVYFILIPLHILSRFINLIYPILN